MSRLKNHVTLDSEVATKVDFQATYYKHCCSDKTFVARMKIRVVGNKSPALPGAVSETQ